MIFIFTIKKYNKNTFLLYLYNLKLTMMTIKMSFNKINSKNYFNNFRSKTIQ